MPFLKELNPLQKEAATFEGGPLLILAGAGSGKTKVLTTRIAHLVRNRGIAPEGILAVTFTNKAAGEMRERLRVLLGAKAEKLWLGTFHSLGLRILKKEGHLIGLNRNMTVYGDDDQLRLVKMVLEELQMSEKAFHPRAILSRIDQAKNEGVSPGEYLSKTGGFFSGKGGWLAERVAEVYSLYQKKLREMNALDFGDLLSEPLRLFKNHPELLRAYQENFLHVLVDEYQDTNRVQYALTKDLAAINRSICAVGDPDQSIYAWRGADIRNIMEFERDWPDSTIFRLEQNYRSTARILRAANSVIEKNRLRYEKSLWTEKAEGSPVRYEECRDERHEASTVSRLIREVIDKETERTLSPTAHQPSSTERRPSLSYRDFAVFYRTNAQSRVIEEQFIRDGVPYAIVGGIRFYERQEIKDALSYLRVLVNPKDSLSLRRIINVPSRGIGAVTLKEVASLARAQDLSLHDGFGEAIKRGIIKKPAQTRFFSVMEGARKEMGGLLPPHEVALKLLEDAGYTAMWEKEATEEAYQRVENIHELISAIKDFSSRHSGPADGRENSTLQDFLEHVSLISDVDVWKDDSDRVTLMTLHSAKGLEFPVVFMAGMEEGLFPHSRSTQSPSELEEERRLCYVGMTRAKEKLFLLSAGTRTLYGETRYQTPSRFIDEIAPEFLERAAEVGAAAYSTTAGWLTGKARPGARPDEPYYTLDDAQTVPAASGAPWPWHVGMKVVHPDFGAGIIKAKEGAGETTKLTVCFLHGAGTKKLVVKYAGLVPG
ncbi:MAG: UvrD-helicase domain-containing protein [Deltaproteobacteria bacterium]|nr:UvrD-helicase domain-containing protein [Deltaproteobacteria bacterium]